MSAVIIDLKPDEEYSKLTETYPIVKFSKIPPPIINLPSKKLRTLLALNVGEKFIVEGRKNTINSWAQNHGKKRGRKFVTRSFNNKVEIYRVE